MLPERALEWKKLMFDYIFCVLVRLLFFAAIERDSCNCNGSSIFFLSILRGCVRFSSFFFFVCARWSTWGTLFPPLIHSPVMYDGNKAR